jgi:hypothetical protein
MRTPALAALLVSCSQVSVPSGPPLKVDWNSFADEHKTNQVAADLKYRGKRVAFTATAPTTEVDPQGQAIIGIVDNSTIGGSCRVRDSDKPKAAALARWNKVSVDCAYDGFKDGFVQLKDCALQ